MSNWTKELVQCRSRYQLLLQQYCSLNLEQPDAHPLAADDLNPWSQHFKDEELRKLITQDVERTFPDYDFFRRKEVQDAMLNILFIYCKLNPDISYRQGMHELVAPVLFIVSENSIKRPVDGNLSETDALLVELLDAQFVQHDSFMIFMKIMELTKSWYYSEEHTPKLESKQAPPQLFDERLFSSPTSTAIVNKSPLARRLSFIYGTMLKKIDKELYKRMKELGIEPQLFGIRWLRLLFGREFYFDKLLCFWDILFADDGDRVSLVDWVAIALLLKVRDSLMVDDFHVALKRLMVYPSEYEPIEICSMAIDLRLRWEQKLGHFQDESELKPPVKHRRSNSQLKSPGALFEGIKKMVSNTKALVSDTSQSSPSKPNEPKTDDFSVVLSNKLMAAGESIEVSRELKSEIFHLESIQKSLSDLKKMLSSAQPAPMITHTPPSTIPNFDDLEELDPWSTQPTSSPATNALPSLTGCGDNKQALNLMLEIDHQLDSSLQRLRELTVTVTSFEKGYKEQERILKQQRSAPQTISASPRADYRSPAAVTEPSVSVNDLVSAVESFQLPSSRSSAVSLDNISQGAIFTRDTSVRNKKLQDLLN